MTSRSRLVYSTQGNNFCPACGKALHKCRCQHDETAASASDGVIRVQRESKGRGGKQVTVISGLPLDSAEAKKLLKHIKAKCGTGGSLKATTMEIQGDRCTEVIELLSAAGYQAKRAGG